MSSESTARPKLVEAISIRPIGLDDYAAVRFVHDTAFRAHCAAHLSEEDAEQFREHIRSREYTEKLQHEYLVGAWLDGELIGTAGWVPANDQGTSARIGSLYVRPLFNHMGVGSLLLARVEQDARNAGFREFSIRAIPHFVPFLAKAGYDVTSRGAQPYGNVSCVVAFMRKRPHAPADHPIAPETPTLDLPLPGAPADLSIPSLALHESDQ